MYRTPPAPPPPSDPLRVEPDGGIRGLLVGRATAADVLRVLGEDCQVNRYANGDVFSIDYSFDADGTHHPDRTAQHARPHQLVFEFGLLKAIRINAYQRDLYTDGDLRIGSHHRDVIRVFGHQAEVMKEEGFQTLRFRGLGIELALDGDDDKLMGFTIFRAAR